MHQKHWMNLKVKNLWQINRLNERCNFGKLDQLDNVFKIFAINYFLKKNTHYKIFLNIKSNGLNKEIITFKTRCLFSKSIKRKSKYDKASRLSRK